MTRHDAGPRVFTSAEAFAQVTQDFEVFRDEVRAMAREAIDDPDRQVRAALVEVVHGFNRLEDTVRFRLGVELRMGRGGRSNEL